MTRVKKAEAPALDQAPSGKPWAYGVRTWGADGSSYGGFKWELTVGCRVDAADWSPVAQCGHGLHCNPEGLGDWALLSADASSILGVVRYDPDLAIDLDGKIKAPWMEIVLTTQTASRASVMGFILNRAREHVIALTMGAGATMATAEGKHASAAGDRGHASAAGYSGHASAAGDRGHASAAGYSGHASAAGDSGHASAAGDRGHASAAGYSGHASAAGDRGHASAAGDRGHASAAGYSGHASAAGDRGHASAAGYSGHASAAGYSGHASAAGKYGIAASFGIEGVAEASSTGAIALSYWDRSGSEWVLAHVFAGMVGQTYGGVTLKAATPYRLKADGLPAEVH